MRNSRLRPRESKLAPMSPFITKAMNTLRKKGYVTRRNYQCCSTCAGAALGAELGKYPEKVVFYHQQDTDTARKMGVLYLRWDGDGSEIAQAFHDAGLTVHWTGESDRCILVRLPGDVLSMSVDGPEWIPR
jgi:hypothetical protein